jgi:hypothetical protein
MGELGAALPRQQQSEDSKIKSENGVYRAIFLGLSAPFQFVSNFANEQCRLCKGQGSGIRGEGKCSQCGGSGRRTEQHVKLSYRLENNNVEEEEVNFKLLPAGMTAQGQPLSPTTLFLRLRTLSGNRNATPADLDAWYSALPKPIKIPCTVVIGDNKSGTASKITAIQLRTQGAPAQAPVAQTTSNDDSSWDTPEDEIPF